MLCTECDQAEDAYAHDAKNPSGHFYSRDRPTIADRGEELRAERKPDPPKVRPQREPRVPTLQDYKWWVRSYRRQRIIRDLAASRLAMHEEALERVTIEADPPEGLAEMVLSPDLEGELREIANQLTRKLEIRKRPPVEKERG